jgi:hypothetical protein
MQRYILSDKRITTVVVVANWSHYFNCPERRACITSTRRVDLSGRPDDTARVRAISEAMDRELESYRLAGKRVVLIYPQPKMPWDVPRYMLFAGPGVCRNYSCDL